MTNSIENVSFNETEGIQPLHQLQNQLVDQQSNSKKASAGLSSVFPSDTIMPWAKENFADIQEITGVQPVKQTSQAEKDKAAFYKSMNDFMKEAKLASEESGMPIRDVFALLNQLQLRDQRDLLNESHEITKQDLLNHIQENRKIQKERIEKMLEAIQRAQKTEFWDHFKNAVSFLQMATTAAEMGSFSSPIGVILTALSVGEAIDSMFDNKVKKFLIEIASQFLPEDKQKGFEEKTLKWARLGLGLSSLCMSVYSANGPARLYNWWNNTPGQGIRISIEEMNRSWFQRINLTEFRSNLWEKRKEIWDTVSGFFSSQAKYLSSTTTAACQGIRNYHEYRGNSLKATLLVIDHSQKQNKTRIDENLKALKLMVDQEQGIWQTQNQIQRSQLETSLKLARFIN